MTKGETTPQTRLSALLVVVRHALLLGLVAAVVGASVGYFSIEASWTGALRGMNWASLILAAYAGMIVVGHSQTRQMDRNLHLQTELADVGRNDVYPWGAILTAFGGSLTSTGLWLLVRLVLNFNP